MAEKKKNILCIDDDDFFRNTIQKILERLGYNVQTADSARNGMKLIELNDFDLILLDLKMPEIDGLKALKMIQNELPLLPIVMISGAGKMDDVIEALRNGAWDFIVKPMNDLSILESTLDKCILKSEQLNENIFYRDHLEKTIQERTNELVKLNEELRIEISKHKITTQNLVLTQFVVDSSYEPILWINAEGTCIYMNNSSKQLFDINIENSQPEKIWDIFSFYDINSWEEKWHSFRTKKMFIAECRFFNSKGQRIELELSINFINFNGQEFLINYIRDITQRKLAEELLRMSEERYRTLVESMPYGLCETGLNGGIIYVNKSFTKIYGYAINEVSKMLFQDFSISNSKKNEYKLKPSSLSNEKPFPESRIEKHKTKTGRIIEVLIDINYKKDIIGNITGLVALITDITEKRGLEKQVAQFEKMHTIGQLAGGIAHDFNNVLTVISGNAQILLLKQTLDLKYQKYLQNILNTVSRAKTITNQLSSFSKREQSNPELINLNATIQETKKILFRLLDENIELIEDLSSEYIFVLADETQIEQILMNLVLNSRDAMPKGGKIILSSRLIEYNSTTIINGITIPEGKYALLSISDTGKGIPKENYEKIFDPLFSTKDSGKGIGLGLSITINAVQKNNGFLTFESEINKGTTFSIYFPLVDKVKSDTEINEITILQGNGEKILVVEDDEGVRNLLEFAIPELGYEVMLVNNGLEALDFLETQEVDLVLSDLIMPGLGGFELAKKIKQKFPTTRMIAMSGYTTNDNNQLFEAGFKEMIPKPLDIVKVGEIIQKVLKQK